MIYDDRCRVCYRQSTGLVWHDKRTDHCVPFCGTDCYRIYQDRGEFLLNQPIERTAIIRAALPIAQTLQANNATNLTSLTGAQVSWLAESLWTNFAREMNPEGTPRDFPLSHDERDGLQEGMNNAWMKLRDHRNFDLLAMSQDQYIDFFTAIVHGALGQIKKAATDIPF